MTAYYTVRQVSQLTGVTVRPLHHYDHIGLLKPAWVGENGYRYYDETSLACLHTILLFKELDLPLSQIKELLCQTEEQGQQVLRDHVFLLELKRERLNCVIRYTRWLIEKGGDNMDFHLFDRRQLEAYQEEVIRRWGGSPSYQEFEESYDSSKEEILSREMQAIFKTFGQWQSLEVEAPCVQEEVGRLQAHITEYYYTCTKEILKNLGLLYREDERFSATIDRFGGPSTAVFVSQAIAYYCQ